MRLELLIFVMTLVAACGGRSEDQRGGDNDDNSSGGGGSGGHIASDGGTSGDGDDIVVTGGSGGAGASGGATACSAFSFWLVAADELIGGLGECGPDVCEEGETPTGSITFGEEGEVIEFSHLNEDTSALFLEEIEGDLWPCLGGESSDYCCHGR
jgi:hypothetical protein